MKVEKSVDNVKTSFTDKLFQVSVHFSKNHYQSIYTNQLTAFEGYNGYYMYVYPVCNVMCVHPTSNPFIQTSSTASGWGACMAFFAHKSLDFNVCTG